MPKRMIWKQMIVAQSQLAHMLTTLNLQPGKFQITSVDYKTILIVYVDKEVPNVD
jgi:hypothetical protein